MKKAESMLWGIDFKGLIKKIFKFQEVSGDLCVCDYNFSGEVPLWCLTHFQLILGRF